jgi:hypothetical protein
MSLTPGSRAILHIAPGRLSRYQGQECDVLSTCDQQGATYADIWLDVGGKEVVPASYLRPVESPQAKRRSPLTLKPERDNRTEEQVQQEGINWLEARGYIVLRIGQSRVPAVCHKCSRDNKRHTQIRCNVCGSPGFSPSTNSTKGTPDLFVSHPRWPRCLWTPLEYKQSEKSERKPEQVALVEKGRSVFVWSLSMAVAAIFDAEQAMGIDSHVDVIEYLLRHGGLPESEAIK